MNAIYRSITGEIQCTMEGGKLYVRKWGTGRANYSIAPVGPWEECTEPESKIMAGGQEGGDWYYIGCLRACLLDDRKSMWFHENESDRLSRVISEITVKRDIALKAEAAERPIPSLFPRDGATA